MTPLDLPSPYAGPPLRVAYIGNFKYPWCTEVHVAASLIQLGHHVWQLQEDENPWPQLVEQAESLGIQLVLWTRTWPAEMGNVVPALDQLRGLGIPSVSYHLDRWFGLNREHQVHDQPFFRTDLVVSPDDSPGWVEAGVNHLWLPPGVFGPECEPVEPNPKRWPWQVVFVGSHPYPHPEWAKYRGDLLATFQRAFRSRFGILPRRGVPVRGRDLQELYATVPVVLGDSCLAGSPVAYHSDRVPESLGRGALLIHPFVSGTIGPGDGDWYRAGRSTGDEDLLGYTLGDFAQAVAVAEWAVANREGEGRTISEHGRTTVLGRDTYAHRMATVLAEAESIHGGYRAVHDDPPTVVDLMANLEQSLAAARSGRPVESYQVPGYPIPTLGPLRPSRGLPVAPQTTTQRRVQLVRMSARFDLRSDVPTDAEVLDEVWTRNDYRVDRFSGTVVDVGANIGAFSVLAAKAGAMRVVAYEPEPGNYGRLVHHLRLNRVREIVEPEAMAVNGHGHSVAIEGTGGGARSINAMDETQVIVPAVSLDELLRTIGSRGGVEFLKMDIEGGEYAAFATLGVDALAYVDRMALEFHGPAMPHLAHLDADGRHLVRWGALVAKLADAGRVEIVGHPIRGGLIHWCRYGL